MTTTTPHPDMTTITLESIETRQTELADMIARFKAQPAHVALPAACIALQPGERYAGMVLDDAGQLKHHLILMAQRPGKKLAWQPAMDWAASVGGTLPDRQEQSLLYANCKTHLPEGWSWSSQTHADDASCAWCCYFTSGYQSDDHKSYEGSAVAVRLIPLNS